MVLYIALTIYSLQLVLACLIVYSDKQVALSEKQHVHSLTIIVPFRNEALRMNQLLKSINDLEVPESLKLELIFVDDHSTDGSKEVIQSSITIDYVILNNRGRGKKAAIQTAADHSASQYILTWDADIHFTSAYLSNLVRLPPADCWVLPVNMTGDSLIQKLGKIEFQWLQRFGRFLVKLQKAKLANGANLFFKREMYLKAGSIRKDFEISSGDDVFLVQAIRRMGGEIRATNHSAITVKSAAPKSWIELLQQRQRWIGKMNNLVDTGTILSSALLFLTQFGFYVVLCCAFFEPLLFIPLFFKYSAEACMMPLKFKKYDVFVLLLHQLWYPFYLLGLFFLPAPTDYRWGKV